LLGKCPHCFIERRLDLFRKPKQYRAGDGRRGFAADPLDEPQAYRLFEFANAKADGRLGKAELLGGSQEASGPGHFRKGLQLAEARPMHQCFPYLLY